MYKQPSEQSATLIYVIKKLFSTHIFFIIFFILEPNLQKGLAMKKLKLVKETNKTMPRHPMPFAAKNMFYDERWIDKQERGYNTFLLIHGFINNIFEGYRICLHLQTLLKVKD